MAHLDVVPVEEASKPLWTVDPFGGVAKDGFIWGRGAVDNKMNLISMLETVEKLLENYQPNRSVYFAFGHDEEVGGSNGARMIARLLQARKVTAEFVLDEGGFVTSERVPGMHKPVALLGTSEKGILALKLSVEKPGGHSSTPEHETAVDIITQALGKIRSKPFNADLTPSKDFIEHIGPELPFLQKLAFANTGLLKSLIINAYEKTPTDNAIIRTTVVPTIIAAGIKENVVPSVATATLNIRLLPGDSISRVTARVRSLIDDDRIKIKILKGREASSITPVESEGYRKTEKMVRQTFSHTTVTPFLLIGATDASHFQPITKGTIRFSPMTDPIGFHGINERVSLESFRQALWFYEQLMRDI